MADRLPVLVINMQSGALDLPPGHLHLCPACYEHVACDECCSGMGEALENGTPLGSPVICDECRRVDEAAHG
jgi:hypothetical protein